MSTKKKVIISVSVTVVVLGIAIGLFFFLKNRNRSHKTVDVFPVNEIGMMGSDMGNWDRTLSGYVAVNMEQKIYLSSSEQVSEVKVQEGDVVKAGDVLLIYDTTAQGLKLEAMRADVEIARTNVLAAERDLRILQNTTPVEPTTEEPSTEEPSTEEPTTEEPTTEKPTTEEPTTEEPTTEKPTTEKPTTEEPTTEEPTTEESSMEEPEVSGQRSLSIEPKDVQVLSEPEEGSEEEEPEGLVYTKEELDKAIAEKQNEIKQLSVDYQLKLVELEILEYQTQNGEVLCNFDGVVKSVMDQEEAILNNEPFIVVSGNDGYTVKGYIGELAMATAKIGDTVSMFSYDNGMSYIGVITEIGDMPIDGYRSYNGTEESYYPMTIAITEGEDLRQNMYMEITLEGANDNSDSIYIPMALIRKENGAYYVMKEEDGLLKKQLIQTGEIKWGDTMEVKAGISYDDYLAIPYSKNAQEGVKTVEKSSSAMYGY